MFSVHEQKKVGNMTILSVISGLLMIFGLMVILLTICAFITEMSWHNIASMLLLATVLFSGSMVILYIQSLFASKVKEKHFTNCDNHSREVVPKKQLKQIHGIQFNPWIDEWYGEGPWWKKW